MKYNYSYCFVALYLTTSSLVWRSCKSRVRNVLCETKWNLSDRFCYRLCFFCVVSSIIISLHQYINVVNEHAFGVEVIEWSPPRNPCILALKTEASCFSETLIILVKDWKKSAAWPMYLGPEDGGITFPRNINNPRRRLNEVCCVTHVSWSWRRRHHVSPKH
jgi:hypothetical protein